MRNAILAVLLLCLPATATITLVQSNANFTCTPSNCTSPSFTPGGGHLLVVWTFWQTSSGTFTATVTDNITPQNNTFYTAVGPTLQSNASTPTTAQVFYAKNINGGSLDQVKVSFAGTGSPTAAGVVVVEYSGADQSNPLDSVSAGYSISAGNLLDSGNAAPANSNLMVFGAGFADPNIVLTAGGGFTTLQAANSSWGTGIVENSTTEITGNTVLQRATACFVSPTGGCSSSSTGNWLMQMAVFRDTSWTVQGGWSSTRPAQIRFADQFPGSTGDAQITNAINAAQSGGTVDARGIILPFTWETTVTIGKPLNLYLPCTQMTFTVQPLLVTSDDVHIHTCGNGGFGKQLRQPHHLLREPDYRLRSTRLLLPRPRRREQTLPQLTSHTSRLTRCTST